MDKDTERWFEKLDRKIDEQTRIITDHRIESGVRHQQVNDLAHGAHRRIKGHEEEHKEKRGWWAALWGGMILIAIERVMSYFRKGD
jgi:hypothetical protein